MAPIYSSAAVLVAISTLSTAAPVHKLQPLGFHKRQSYNPASNITWGACPDGFSSSVTCATYVVPLDWNQPQGNETIELGMVRIEATDKENRIGNLFINPGGPGGQASQLIDIAAASPGVLDPEILSRFDIIGLDPRGVGLSTPVQCDVDTYNKRISFFPETEEQFNDLVNYNQAVAESCRQKTGRLIDFVDTISAVKDHEAVRLALGGEKATFLGLSYGTQLFSQYAQLFPDGARAILLDGNLQHSQSESSNHLIESTTYESTLKQFFKWCTSTDGCPLRGQDVEAKYTSVLNKAIEAPIPAPGCDDVSCRSDVTEEELRFNLQSFLISPFSWPSLGQALIDADDGNATAISSMQPLAVGSAYDDSFLFAGTAIQCQDWAHGASTLADVQDKERLGVAFSPLTQGACQSYKIQTSCIGWPAALTNPPKPVSYAGETPILMVNSIYDPSTSYTWALGLQSEIGNAVLLTRNGFGHTSYLSSPRTAQIENAYLLNLTLPEPGTVVDEQM
ncbi:TAP-like protein-domain-containing protein [Biscogniauxia mediterranea]|nr:TAP-like protein-domain-containing protein [Biscogniauxia mediterranea]